MDYYGNNDYRDYLAHYGVKGMEWGKHKFGSIFYALAKANGAVRKKSTPKWKRSSSYQKYLSKRNAILSKGSNKKKSTLLQLDNNLEKNKGNKAEAASEKTTQNAKEVLKVAKEIIRGKYGSGSKRRAALTKKYGDWAVYQNKVNELLGSKKRHPVGGTTSSSSTTKRKTSGSSGGSTVKTTSRSSSRRSTTRTSSTTRRSTSRRSSTHSRSRTTKKGRSVVKKLFSGLRRPGTSLRKISGSIVGGAKKFGNTFRRK